ncbi:cell wall-binding repeat-containing protein [Egibacter rhizosphaerae]|uniref:Cell wall-binding repeat-containing protein n=1 Tax=Egibacter rhizosphaerae TaxID=1670831 RepID=A0A411YFW7_9ACTN|nr:cell wall-binding repeat-containing protein [Egibacter rhizosphaerae]QBI20069.1 cell wall-binding repeat-containing protein [Egibacter rhizosphaerae]
MHTRHHPARARGAVIAILVLAFTALLAGVAHADEDADVWRMEGDDRFGTAVAVSEQQPYYQFPEDIIVATGMNYPDALAAGPAAHQPGAGRGSILLTARNVLPSVTEDRIGDILPDTIYLVGGTAAVSREVEAELYRLANDVERIAGPTRFHTAAEVSRTFFSGTGGDVVVATGTDYPDALSGTPLARAAGGPALLTARDHLPSPTEDELSRLSPDRVFVIGGTAAISDSVISEIRSTTSAEVFRIAGANRYDTSARVAELISGRQAFVATGEDYPDALTGGALAGYGGDPVMLVAQDHAPEPVLEQLREREAEEIIVLGGTSAVSSSTEEELRYYEQGGGNGNGNGPCPPEPGSPC